MAKKVKNSLNSDLDLDMDLDMDEFNFDDLDKKDDRKPVVKVLTSMPRGVLNGVRDTTFLKKTLKDSLPKGFGDSLDLSDKLTDGVKSIYDDTIKEMKPAINEFKRIAPKLISKDSKFVPQSVKDLMTKWESERNPQSKDQDLAQQREAMLSGQLLETFKAQTDQTTKIAANQEGRDRLQEGLAMGRHKDLFSLANSQAISLNKIQQYQSNITLAYQKKSLELQYRSLFATQDILSFNKESTDKVLKALEGIGKNTALPEFTKIQGFEGIKQTMKNKFANSVSNSLFGDKSQYLENLVKGIKTNVSTQLKDFKSGVMDGLSAVEAIKDQQESMRDMPGMDGYTMMGEQAGSMGGQFVGEKLIKGALKSKTYKSIDNRFGISDKIKRAGLFANNFDRKAETFRRNNDIQWQDGAASKVMTFAQNLMPGQGVDKQLDRMSSKDIHAPYTYTRRTDKSITEIIPGYLARILREVQITRTGNTKIALTSFDIDSGKFTGSDKIEKKIFEQVINQNEVKQTRDSLNQILNLIDPKWKLSDKARQEIKKKLIKNDSDRQEANETNLATDDAYRHLSKDLIQEIVPFMSKFMKGMDTDTKIRFSDQHNRLASSIGDKRSVIQTHSDLGNIEQLEKLGLVDKNGNIDTDKILEYYTGDSKSSLKSAGNVDKRSFGKISAVSKADKAIAKTTDSVKATIKQGTDYVSTIAKPYLDKAKTFFDDQYKEAKALAAPYKEKGLEAFKEYQIKSDKLRAVLENFLKKPSSGKPESLMMVYKAKLEQAFKVFKSELESNSDLATSDYNAKENIKPFSGQNALAKLKAMPITQWAYKQKEKLTQKGQELIGPMAQNVNKVLGNEAAPDGKKINLTTLNGVNMKAIQEVDKRQERILNYLEKTSKNVNTIRKVSKKEKIERPKYRTAIQPTEDFGVKVKGLISKGLGSTKERLNDLYIAGSTNPRLLAIKMQAGQYRDKLTNRVITDPSDIKGDVIDENNKIVLSGSEKLDLYYYDGKTKLFQKYKDFKSQATDFFNNDLSNIRGKADNLIAKTKSDLMSKTQSFISNTFGKFKDVYVEGDPIPRLYATKLRNGDYRDKESNATITDPSLIKGEVIDENNIVVLRLDELDKMKVYEPRIKRFTSLNAIGRGLLGIGGALWYYQTKIAPKWTAWNFKQLGKLLSFGKNITMNLIRGKVKDVYVEGDEDGKPRLYATRIKNGDYKLVDGGKTISHQNQITGPIQDIEGNIIISEDDLPKLRVYDSVLKWLNPFKLAGMAIKGVSKVAMFGMKKGFQASMFLLKGLGNLAAKSVKGIVNWLSKPGDVYIKGQSNKSLPKLIGIDMANGKYFSFNTKKPILKLSDIDGPVMDASGSIVITEDDVRNGLFNKDGKPIKMGLFGAIGKGINKALGIFRYKTKLGDFKDAKNLKKTLSPTDIIQSKSLSTLESIKDIINKKFNKKKLSGDSDGDGVIEGSYKDKMNKKDKSGKAKWSAWDAVRNGAKDAAKKPEEGKGFLATLAGLFSSFGGMMSGLVGGLARIGGMLAGVAKVAGGVFKIGGSIAAAGLGVYNAVTGWKDADKELADGKITQKEAGVKKGSAVGGGAGMAVGAVAGTIIGSIGGPIGMLIGGYLGGKLGSAVGTWIGTKAVKAYQANDKDSALDYFRLVQYGFPKEQTEMLGKVIQLESYLYKFVSTGERLEINETNADVKEMMSPFGLDHTNEQHLVLFFEWYQKRFKPIWFRHMAAARAATGKIELSGIGKLKPNLLKQYLDFVKFSDGPYTLNQLPVLDAKYSATSSKDVESLFKEISDNLLKEIRYKSGNKGVEAATAASASGLVTNQQGKLVDPSISLKDPKQIKLPTGSVTVSGVPWNQQDSGDVKALDAVRFKIYGLEKLDDTKVKALILLEKEVLKGVKVNGKNIAMWEGDVVNILSIVSGAFGISDLTGANANNWYVWFKSRFLPIYMGYLSGLKVLLGKIDNGSFGMKDKDQLEMAKILMSIANVWNQNVSPWSGFILNRDPKTCDENIRFLENTAKVEELNQQSAKSVPIVQSNTPTVAPTNNPANSTKPSAIPRGQVVSSPDSETQEKVSYPSNPMSDLRPGNITMAAGPLSDGRNAAAYISAANGINLQDLNPEMLKKFNGMAEEYGTLTGKKVRVISGFRTFEQQVALKNKLGARAAAPGSSLHEFGLAMDIDPKTLNEMENLGLMRKYGFTRPVGGEDWHMEPIGVQSNIDAFKADRNAATQAIANGAGLGGGGLGTIPNSPKFTRNKDLSMKIMGMKVGPTDNMSGAKTIQESIPTPVAQAKPTVTQTPVSSPQAKVNTPSSGVDNEAKVSSGGYAGSAKAVSQGSLMVGGNNLPADPTVKIPEPKGGGYEGLKDTIFAAAKMVGTDGTVLAKTVAMESGFNTNAKASTSSATGLAQFTDAAWSDTVKKHGNKYGLNLGNADRTDAKASLLMAAHFQKDTERNLSGSVNQFGATENYIGHFFGPTGSKAFFNALKANPNSIGAEVLPNAAASNKPIFYDGNRPRTVSEIYNLLDKRIADKSRSYGIDSGVSYALTSGSTPVATPTGNKPTIMTASFNPTGDTTPMVKPTALEAIPIKKKPDLNIKQMSSPAAASYGFNSVETSALQVPPAPNQIGQVSMARTEELLSKSLEVQTSQLNVMSKLFDVVSKGQTLIDQKVKGPEDVKVKDRYSGQDAPTIQMPKARVPMLRSI